MAENRRTVVVIGPGPQFKGGLANYTLSLCRGLAQNPHNKVYLLGWTHQYPAIIPRDFKDRVSQPVSLQEEGITETALINYNNPASWQKTVGYIANLQPDIVVCQWSIALQGLPLGYIAGRLKKKGIPFYFDCHFVIQKEATALDGVLSRYALSKAGGFVVHARKTADELQQLLPAAKLKIMDRSTPGLYGPQPDGRLPVIKLFHPVYDMFKPRADFNRQAFKDEHNLQGTVFLFFGFIRKYKGLHFCLEAFAKLLKTHPDASLMVVGESFWKTLDEKKLSTRIKSALFKAAKAIVRKNEEEDESHYNPLALIDSLGLKDKVMVVNTFVSNQQVYQYFQAADALLLFYEYATPSGVESMAYNFKIPILATAVGHFPETITNGVNGYLAAPADTTDMARVMARLIENPVPAEGVDEAARHWTWQAYGQAILGQ